MGLYVLGGNLELGSISNEQKGTSSDKYLPIYIKAWFICNAYKQCWFKYTKISSVTVNLVYSSVTKTEL